MNKKVNNLQKYMSKNNIDLIFLDNPSTVAYFTNFESNPHERIVAYIVLENDHFLFVPALEQEEAKLQSNVTDIYSYKDEENPWEIIKNAAFKYTDKVNAISIDDASLSVERYYKLQEYFNTTDFLDVGSFINTIRIIKTEDEIEKMIKAGELADEALEIGLNTLKVDITEQEVAATIDMEMKRRGVTAMSFTTLVLFGDHAASPHGVTGDRKLQANEFVLFDLGVIYEGYASDVTRTIAFGDVTDEEIEVYNVVLEAQLAAQEAAKPGMRAGELDQIARKIIDDAGYGEYFNHRLGHGIGKTAHEFPSIHGDNETILEPGMCFSIEPGIYIPRKVGVRVEDCVYVTEDGVKPFTFKSKELNVVKAK